MRSRVTIHFVLWLNAFASSTENVFEISLITRSYSGARPKILHALSCMEATVPGTKTEIVYVFDDENPEDHKLGDEIMKTAETTELAGLVRIVYEPLPRCSDQIFIGWLEGSKGKDRSQRSNFLFDKYASAPVVGFFDGEVCFTAPIIPSYFIRKGKIQSLVMIDMLAPEGADHYGVDKRALNLPTILEQMWVDVFPMLYWRHDLANAREFIIARFKDGITEFRKRCDFENDFDAAFGLITRTERTWGYYNAAVSKASRQYEEDRRWGYSQFNILANFVLHRNPGGYDFRVLPNPDGYDSAAMSSVQQVSAFKSKYPNASAILAQGADDIFVIGSNSFHHGHVWNIPQVCCSVHAEFMNESEVCSHLAPAKNYGLRSAGRCQSGKHGDACAQDFFLHTRNFFKTEVTEKSRSSAVRSCIKISEQIQHKKRYIQS